MVETILKCRNCNQALCIDREPVGQTKAGKPTKRMKDTLKCPNCGKVYEKTN